MGLLTGDAVVNRKAPIMVMTTEILRNMLYERCNLLIPPILCSFDGTHPRAEIFL